MRKKNNKNEKQKHTNLCGDFDELRVSEQCSLECTENFRMHFLCFEIYAKTLNYID